MYKYIYTFPTFMVSLSFAEKFCNLIEDNLYNDLTKSYNKSKKHYFSNEEIVQAKKLKFPKRKLEWLAGRLAAKLLVYNYLKNKFSLEIEPAYINIESNCKPPKIKINSEISVATTYTNLHNILGQIYLSISHSSKYAIATLHYAPIGLDLESSRNIDIKLGSKFLSYNELNKIPKDMWLAAWAAKEATYKALCSKYYIDGNFIKSVSIDFKNYELEFDNFHFDRPMKVLYSKDFSEILNIFITKKYTYTVALAWAE